MTQGQGIFQKMSKQKETHGLETVDGGTPRTSGGNPPKNKLNNINYKLSFF